MQLPMFSQGKWERGGVGGWGRDGDFDSFGLKLAVPMTKHVVPGRGF